jgi:hypothetical protein
MNVRVPRETAAELVPLVREYIETLGKMKTLLGEELSPDVAKDYQTILTECRCVVKHFFLERVLEQYPDLEQGANGR